MVWTWDGNYDGWYTTDAPRAQSFSLLEAMRTGMLANKLYNDGTNRYMGLDASVTSHGLTTTAWVGFSELSTTITAPSQRPRGAIYCAMWTFTPELFVRPGVQSAKCTNSDDLAPDHVWTVDSTTPMPATAPIGSSGVLGSGNIRRYFPNSRDFVLAVGSITWKWEFRQDGTDAPGTCEPTGVCVRPSALLCAERRVSNPMLAMLNATRCSRVTKDGDVTGVYIPEYSSAVQPLP